MSDPNSGPMSDKIEDGRCAMSPRAGYRIVTPADREAHPLVPEGALVNWCKHGDYLPSANAGTAWSTTSNYLIPLGLWPEGDPAPEHKTMVWNTPSPPIKGHGATVQVPAELAQEIAYLLADRAAAMLERRVEDEKPSLSDHAMIGRLYGTRDRLRACPGYGADAARTVRKEAT